MLVDLDTARRNLHQLDTSDDDTIVFLVRTASEHIVRYLKLPADSYQDDDGAPLNVPLVVQQAVVLAVQSLYDDPSADPITAAVRSLLMQVRDPTLA